MIGLAFHSARALDRMGDIQRRAYNRTCTVETYSETETAPGTFTPAWTTVASAVPCSFHPRSGAEVVRAGQLSAEQPVLVKMDYRDATGAARNVDAEDRIVMDDGTVLEVVGPPEDVQGLGRWLHLTCRHAQNVGAE